MTGFFMTDEAIMLQTIKANDAKRAAAQAKARAEAVQMRWNVSKALTSGIPYVEGYEVHGTATGGDMVLHWGFGEGVGTVHVTIVDLSSSASVTVNGTAAQVKAAIRLFMEGDRGNEGLYPLAEAIQHPDKAFRFIP